jgi:hypothetical protein
VQKQNNANLSQLLNEDSNQMFDTRFLYSVAHMKTNSQISESFPFEVVSRMLDSHIQNGSSLKDQAHLSDMIRLEDTKPSKPNYIQNIPKRRLQDYNLPELVEKFLSKDSSLDSSIQRPSAEKDVLSFYPKKIPNPESLTHKFNSPNQVFAYKEAHANQRHDNLKTDRTDRTEKPLAQNYILDKKLLYNQAKKNGKRPKSSSNSQGPNKKVSTKKPVVFLTIDNRAPTSLMTQKYSWKDINNLNPTINSPSETPSKGINKQVHDIMDVTNRPKVRGSKQPVSIKTKNENQTKVYKPYTYSYKSETIEQYKYKQPRDGSKKSHAKTDRHKFKINQDNIQQMVESNTLNSAQEHQSNFTDKSASNAMKWTLKSREQDKNNSKNRKIDDFEKLFYQSMSNEKGKTTTRKGIDLSHLKSFKIQSPTTYRSLSKQGKAPKLVKNKKSFKMYEAKTKKLKRVSPTSSKYTKHR